MKGCLKEILNLWKEDSKFYLKIQRYSCILKVLENNLSFDGIRNVILRNYDNNEGPF